MLGPMISSRHECSSSAQMKLLPQQIFHYSLEWKEQPHVFMHVFNCSHTDINMEATHTGNPGACWRAYEEKLDHINFLETGPNNFVWSYFQIIVARIATQDTISVCVCLLLAHIMWRSGFLFQNEGKLYHKITGLIKRDSLKPLLVPMLHLYQGWQMSMFLWTTLFADRMFHGLIAC